MDDFLDPFLITRDGAKGLPYHRFRTSAYAAPTRGIRVVQPTAADPLTLLRAFALALSANAAFSVTTAAWLHSTPLPDYARRDGLVHVHVPAGAAAPRRPRLRAHRVMLPPDHVTEVLGLPVTTPARTFADLGASLRVEDLVAVGDALLRRDLADPYEIAAVLAARRHVPGVATARRALPLLDGRAESPRESRLRALVLLADLPAPTPNAVIRDRDGQFLARGDLVYEELRIVIEYDGGSHADPVQRAKDATRRTLLREHGWYVVEITAHDLRRPELALAKIRAALRARGVLV